MKRLTLLSIVLLAAGMALLQQGCGLHFVVRNSGPMDPYPNATHIETRVRIQVNRISTALNAGNLDQDAANGLAGNDELVRRFAREFRAQFNQTQDLTAQQTFQLNSMLNDNDRSITDAIQNREAWNQYFGGGGNPDQAFSGNSGMNMAYLDYQWNQQQSRIDAETNAGRLTNAQAHELRQRIQVTRDMKINFFHQNGRMVLSNEQNNQLNQMTRDNGNYLNYRTKGSHGKWDQSRFNQWKQQNPHGLNRGNDNGNNNGSLSTGVGNPGPGGINSSPKFPAQDLSQGANGNGSSTSNISSQNGGTRHDKRDSQSKDAVTQENGFGHGKNGSTPPTPIPNNGSTGSDGANSNPKTTNPDRGSDTNQLSLPKNQRNDSKTPENSNSDSSDKVKKNQDGQGDQADHKPKDRQDDSKGQGNPNSDSSDKGQKNQDGLGDQGDHKDGDSKGKDHQDGGQP